MTGWSGDAQGTRGLTVDAVVDRTRGALSFALRTIAAGARMGADAIDRLKPGGSSDGTDRGRVVHYVPRELCVVVSTERMADAAGFYRSLWTSLGRTAQALLRQAAQPSGDYTRRPSSLEQDLAPATLLRYSPSGSIDGLIGPFARIQPPGGEEQRPFVLFPAAREGRMLVLAFCQAGPAGAPHDVGSAGVRELANLLNTNLDRVNLDLLRYLREDAQRATASHDPRVEAATPNWLAAGTPYDFTDAGPGAAPVPLDAQRMNGPGRWRFRFDRAVNQPEKLPRLDDLVAVQRKRARDGGRSDVLVAVLDTCPTRQHVDSAAAKPEYQGNLLLKEVADPANVSIDEAPSLDGGQLLQALTGPINGPIKVNWEERLVRPGTTHKDYLMVDHGLFAAGIVRDIAPTADIRLIRVLDDYGVGDLFGLSHVLSQLPALLETSGKRRLVVNLSLVMDVPPDDALLEWWFPATSRDVATFRTRFAEVSRLTDLMRRGLDGPIAWLHGTGKNVLVVAAAGNDNVAGAGRPAPRWPARDDRVLGVAAVNGRGGAAGYTNKGDFVVLGNGVATYGGDAVAAAPGDLPVIDAAGIQAVDAVAGVFTSNFPLLTLPQQNHTGWAYWAGTSFATPVVSAIAADVWASDAGNGLAADKVLDAVRAYSAGAGPDLDCPFIPARQEYVSEE